MTDNINQDLVCSCAELEKQNDLLKRRIAELERELHVPTLRLRDVARVCATAEQDRDEAQEECEQIRRDAEHWKAELSSANAELNEARRQLAEAQAPLVSQLADTSALSAAIAEAVEPYRKDAAEWGPALNEASWRLVESFPGKLTGDQFNNCKTPLRTAVMSYFAHIDAALAKSKEGE